MPIPIKKKEPRTIHAGKPPTYATEDDLLIIIGLQVVVWRTFACSKVEKYGTGSETSRSCTTVGGVI